MAFIPPRPPGPNPGRMAAQRAAQQAQQAGMRAQQAARNAGVGAYLAAQRGARRAGAAPDVEEVASTMWMVPETQRPSAFGAALRGALGALAILLVFDVVNHFAAPPQASGSLLLFAASVVALLMGYRVTTATGRLGAATFCGLLIGVGLALLGFLTFVMAAPALPASATPLSLTYATYAEVTDIRTLVILAGAALAGGIGARFVQLLRNRHV